MNRQDNLGALNDRIVDRRRVLDEARMYINAGETDKALMALLDFCERVQRFDEATTRLHRECLAMVEQSRKVLELDASRRPVVIKIGPDGEHE